MSLVELGNILTAEDVAKALKCSVKTVYRRKHELGGCQVIERGRLLFFENLLAQRMERNANALQGEERLVERDGNAPRKTINKELRVQSRREEMGGPTKGTDCGSDPNRHGLLDRAGMAE